MLLRVSPKEWKECPKYASLRENRCHFGTEHTQIWTVYKVQLRSRDQHIVYDEVQFTVENIGKALMQLFSKTYSMFVNILYI